MALGEASPTPLTDLTFRPATDADLPICAAIWRTSINDYTDRINQPEIPDDLVAILRLYGHFRATDPERFIVAERADGPDESRVVGFAAALRRGPLWFLSMLFVLPAMQGAGLGRALMDRVLPAGGDVSLATCTDSAQPISNALYASLGIAPRMPLMRLVGLPERGAALKPLPDGIRAVPVDEVPKAAIDGLDHGLGGAALDDELAALDRDVLGFDHLEDHEFVRREGRSGFLFLGPDGGPVGYGYASEAGRVGPVAVRDPDLLDAAIGHLVTTVRPRGAFGIWLPGAAETAMTSLLQAGFRLDGFPCLVCWDRPLIDFSRYVPTSPGLL